MALLRAIENLPPGYRLMLILHDIHGYEHQEIAEIFGCTTGNTKSQLHKAEAGLRAVIGRPNDETVSTSRKSFAAQAGQYGQRDRDAQRLKPRRVTAD